VDGEPVGTSPHRQRLLDAGFLPGYRGLVLRAPAVDRRNGDERPPGRPRERGWAPPDARAIRTGKGW
jgi:hypothetical protein